MPRQSPRKSPRSRHSRASSSCASRQEYPWVSYAQAHKNEKEAESLGVSQVARGKGGFMRVYEKHGPRTRTLPVSRGGDLTWGRKRRNFVARHMAQYRKKPTLRRWLALMMWAYKAGPRPS